MVRTGTRADSLVASKPKLSGAKGLSRLHANILAADWMQGQESWTAQTERAERALVYDIRALDMRTSKSLKREDSSRFAPQAKDPKPRGSSLLGVATASGISGPSFFDGPLQSLAFHEASTFKPDQWEIRPPTRKAFFETLKAHNVRFTTNYNPTCCPLHDSGPANEALLKACIERHAQILNVSLGAQPREASAEEKTELAALKADMKKLQPKVDAYRLHLAQYETARATMKQHERDIRPGRMVMYRDFVNQHTNAGNKVNSLVLVFLYRERT
jgi:hypothetical protein